MTAIFNTEVLVAGGGPAGLAAAIAARQCGLEVTLVDCARPPIDKACGEGIMPDGLAALAKIGVTLSAENACPFQGIRFINENCRIEADFVHGYGYGIRRIRLHQLLIDRAAELGVEMHWGVRVSGATSNGVLIDGREAACKWLVCADGQNSRLRSWLGMDTDSRVRQRFGFRRHFRVPPWADYVEIHWSTCGQIYVTPVSDQEVCVALITRDPHLRFSDSLKFFPEIEERLRGAASTTDRGAVTPTRNLRSVCRERSALIGEASGSVDAITGDGLSMSFQQAAALAEAMRDGDLRSYQKAHRRIAGLPRVMAGLMLTMDQNHRFRRRMFLAFAAEPNLFSKLLAIHTGAVSPLLVGPGHAVSLGWHLLTA
ncbi:MAG: FAD-dependent monooxygenase [Acidobacteria bacterium]|nr:FAD-dependent monooxygenase [Acidobacteriota bacterium]MBV9147858.1 FAD-dependent monooxygenase [Acidobacteriota bacterium]MBV9435216.1 FAD-dependent monooxygenase [Acidobacteriota bacterium]